MSIKLRTVPALAEELDLPTHVVNYLIKTRGIEEAGRAGHYRVFTEKTANELAQIVKDLPTKREAPSPTHADRVATRRLTDRIHRNEPGHEPLTT